MRIASLLPSATEIVASLGAVDELVGISHECDYPSGVAGRAVLTRPRISFSGGSVEIDRDVRALIEGTLAVYEIDVPALERAAPDVIVTQDLCDVCAVSFEDVRRAALEVCGPDVRIVNLHPTQLCDVRDDIVRVAQALGREAEGRAVLETFDARIEAVRARAAQLDSRPAVLTIEWLDPVMIGGTWMPKLVELAGGRALVTRHGDHAPTLDRAALAALQPDVVVVKPCGFDLERSRAELGALAEQLAECDWPALRTDSVWLADGNAFFNRPGPRLADSAEILAACVHPEAFEDFAELHRASFERIALR